MRAHWLSCLMLAVSLPAVAQPAPAPAAAAPTEAATEAPTATEGAAPRPSSMPPTRIAGIVVGSTGLALTFVGLGFAIAATVGEPGRAGQSGSRPVVSSCGVHDESCFGGGLTSLSDTGDDYATVAGVSLGVGLTTGLVGLILISIPAPTTSQGPTVSFDLGAGTAGVRGTF